jgi:hypothetical protein
VPGAALSFEYRARKLGTGLNRVRQQVIQLLHGYQNKDVIGESSRPTAGARGRRQGSSCCRVATGATASFPTVSRGRAIERALDDQERKPQSPARDWGASSTIPLFGGLTGTDRTATLQDPLEERTWIYEVDRDRRTVMFQARASDLRLELPMDPMLGTVGVAPAAGEVRSSLVPDAFGGNMDTPESLLPPADACEGVHRRLRGLAGTASR